MMKVVCKFASGDHFNAPADRIEEGTDISGNLYVKAYKDDKLIALMTASELSGIYLSETKEKNND